MYRSLSVVVVILCVVATTSSAATVKKDNNIVTLTPYGSVSECTDGSTPYGEGYSLPFDECLQFYDYYVYVSKLGSTNVEFAYYSMNCSDAPLSKSTYSLGSCASYSLPDNSTAEYAGVLSIGSTLPQDAIEYIYYYYSYFCSGPTYSHYFTNGYSDATAKYLCVDGHPQVYECQDSGSCTPTDIAGCQISTHNQTMPYRVKC
eukprot:gene7011-8148_t